MNSGELNASPFKPPSEREVDAEGRRKELTKNLSFSFRKRTGLAAARSHFGSDGHRQSFTTEMPLRYLVRRS